MSLSVHLARKRPKLEKNKGIFSRGSEGETNVGAALAQLCLLPCEGLSSSLIRQSLLLVIFADLLVLQAADRKLLTLLQFPSCVHHVLTVYTYRFMLVIAYNHYLQGTRQFLTLELFLQTLSTSVNSFTTAGFTLQGV